MSTELAMKQNDAIAIWEDPLSLKEIRELFAPNLTELEFKGFVNMGKAMQLNPFLKELWAVKYDKTKPAQYFIGRDGYRKSAQQHPDYDFHRVEAVYSEDFFEMDNGKINHKYKFGGRGLLLGAYCIVKKKSSSQEIYVSVSIQEYDKKQSNWNSMKETMIKKVAESQGLRMAFQERFAGTYHADEQIDTETGEVIYIERNSQTEKLNKILDSKTNVVTVDADIDEKQPESKQVHNAGRDDLPINEGQIAEIEESMHEKEFTDERKQKVLDYFGVASLYDMTDAQARVCLLQLGKA